MRSNTLCRDKGKREEEAGEEEREVGKLKTQNQRGLSGNDRLWVDSSRYYFILLILLFHFSYTYTFKSSSVIFKNFSSPFQIDYPQQKALFWRNQCQ